MTLTHELGHLIGGWCGGARLIDFDLCPWHLPYSLFDPDPYPLVTLWAGPIFGALAPVLLALAVQRDWTWFVAYFSILANGVYLGAAWYLGDSHLDTARLLQEGASSFSIFMFCTFAIATGYLGFRRQCVRLLSSGAGGPHAGRNTD